MKRIALIIAPVLLAGCAIVQEVKPVQVAAKQICIVANPKVMQAEFVEVYQRELTAKGFDVKLLSPDSPLTACPLTSTYSANWRWDLALYMAYAELKVYSDGKLVGEAVYDSRGGGASFSKFIRAEEKIKELVGLLFPKGAGG
ncbi:MAG TPA: Sbal_3080 family lipoprotein [Burkholderiaceae bacterium]|nr:Sbal_3080 family lipoprotein [Burkholderiaceae bacterium]